MKVNLNYNEFIKKYELDISQKIGFIQEKILSLTNLLIYNIEYSKIKINNNFYILGSDDLPFNLNLKDFLDNNNLDENDIQEIIIYDRKRDENGNVIKENIIIDKYNQWFINNENESYLNYIENNNNLFNNFENNNTHIIRFPIDMILENILRVPLNNIINIPNNNELQDENNNELKDENNDELKDENNNELQDENNDELKDENNDELKDENNDELQD